jgi:hypothetical protein
LASLVALMTSLSVTVIEPGSLTTPQPHELAETEAVPFTDHNEDEKSLSSTKLTPMFPRTALRRTHNNGLSSWW